MSIDQLNIDAASPPPGDEDGGRSDRLHRLRRFMENKIAVIAAVVIIVMLLLAIIGPFFTPSATYVDVTNKLATPSAQHWLGTDGLGRDVLARVLVGGRVSFGVAFGATLMAVIPAGILGMYAGYYRGRIDEICSRIFDILLAVPVLLLAVIVVAALGPSLRNLVLALGVSNIPQYGRLFRALTIEAREREYIKSSVALGFSDLRILLRHVLPNIIVAVTVIATGNLGKVALSEASLSFLGVGVQPPTPSWGNMIAESQPYLQSHPLIALGPGLAITVVTLAFSFAGDGLRDAYDVREQSSRRK